MKAFILIDTDYIACPIEDCRVVYSVYDSKNKNHKMVSGIGKLRQFPKKTGQEPFCRDIADAVRLGWDKCLEEITGETE